MNKAERVKAIRKEYLPKRAEREKWNHVVSEKPESAGRTLAKEAMEHVKLHLSKS